MLRVAQHTIPRREFLSRGQKQTKKILLVARIPPDETPTIFQDGSSIEQEIRLFSQEPKNVLRSDGKADS